MASRVQNLYRCFDAAGDLLYVGVSWTTAARFKRHSETSHWWREVSSIRLETFASRRAAERAEQVAIKTERPKFNRAHAVGKPVPAKQRVAEGSWQVTDVHRTIVPGRWEVGLLPPGAVIDLGTIVSADSPGIAVEKAIAYFKDHHGF